MTRRRTLVALAVVGLIAVGVLAASDGVAKVGVIDEQDRLVPMADVDGNAFYADAPEGRVKSVVALDEAGEVIWRSPPRTPPDE